MLVFGVEIENNDGRSVLSYGGGWSIVNAAETPYRLKSVFIRTVRTLKRTENMGRDRGGGPGGPWPLQ